MKTEYAEEISKFVTKDDLKRINYVTQYKGYQFSIRETGSNTVERLRYGAAAKPHSVLNKTIKQSIFGFDDKAEDFWDKIKAVSGYVTHTEVKDLGGNNFEETIDGIFLNKDEIERFKQDSNFSDYNQDINSVGKEYYIVIKELKDMNLTKQYTNDAERQKNKFIIKDIDKMAKIPEAFNDNKNVPYFMTGDYDLHDLWNIKTVVPSDVDMNVIIKINDAMDEYKIQDPENKHHPSKPREKMKINATDRFQHGPQYNYIAFMLTDKNEGRDKIVPVVAKSAFAKENESIAFFYKGGYEIIKTLEDYMEFYRKCGITLKQSWMIDDGTDKYIK